MQITCTVRTAAAVPVKSYHTPSFSSVFCSKKKDWKFNSKPVVAVSLSLRQLNLSSRNRSNGIPISGVSAAASTSTISVI